MHSAHSRSRIENQENSFERSRKHFCKIKEIPLKDRKYIFVRSRKYFSNIKKLFFVRSRKYLWKIKNSPGRFAGGSVTAFAGLTLCTSCLNIIFIIFLNCLIPWFFYLMFLFIIHLGGWSSSRAGRTGTDEDSWMLKSLRCINYIFIIIVVSDYRDILLKMFYLSLVL